MYPPVYLYIRRILIYRKQHIFDGIYSLYRTVVFIVIYHTYTLWSFLFPIIITLPSIPGSPCYFPFTNPQVPNKIKNIIKEHVFMWQEYTFGKMNMGRETESKSERGESGGKGEGERLPAYLGLYLPWYELEFYYTDKKSNRFYTPMTIILKILL